MPGWPSRLTPSSASMSTSLKLCRLLPNCHFPALLWSQTPLTWERTPTLLMLWLSKLLPWGKSLCNTWKLPCFQTCLDSSSLLLLPLTIGPKCLNLPKALLENQQICLWWVATSVISPPPQSHSWSGQKVTLKITRTIFESQPNVMEKWEINLYVSQQNVYNFIVAPKASAEGPIYGFESRPTNPLTFVQT